MIDVSGILRGILENFLHLVPVTKVHEYERGVFFGWVNKFNEDGSKRPWYLWEFMVGHALREDLRAGFYFYVPGLQSIEVVPIKPHTYHLWKASVQTKDGKNIAVRSNFGYSIWCAWRKYNKVHDFENTMSAEAEVVLTDTIRSHNLEDLRGDSIKAVEEEMVRTLAKKAKKWGARIHTFSITECVPCMHIRLIQS